MRGVGRGRVAMGGSERGWVAMGGRGRGWESSRRGRSAGLGGRHDKVLGTGLGLGGELLWYGANVPRAEDRRVLEMAPMEGSRLGRRRV